MSCTICLESCTKVVTCAKCQGSSCTICFQKYLLNSGVTPTCMHCRVNLSDDIIYEHTEVGWIMNVYETHRLNLLFDIEKSRLSEDQVYAEHYNNAKATINTIDLSIKVAKDMKERKRLINTRHYYIELVKMYGKSKVVKAKPKKVYLKGCVGADCKGFLGADFSCGLCNVKVCKNCHEVRLVGHVCNKDIVASVAAISKEAKACPACASMISKIDGCDQMWCTQCHMTFSWITGLQDTGVTHNPHFYEWARKNGTLTRSDIPNNFCNIYPSFSAIHDSVLSRALCDLSDYSELTVAQASKLNSDGACYVILVEYYRYVHHIRETIINRTVLTAGDNYDLRVRYLANELPESKFKLLLAQRDQLFRKNLSAYYIYDMIYQASGDLYRNIIAGADLETVRQGFGQLFQYGNQCLRGLEDRWHCEFVKLVIY